MIRLLLADVKPLETREVYAGLYECASPGRRAAADSFRFRKDRNLSLGAAALLDRGLRSFGLRERDMSYGKTEYGKPFFLSAPDIHFSISHSSTKVAVVFSDQEVGCDIEEVNDIDMAVAKRFFHSLEYDALMAERDIDARRREFFRIWTLKESYMKATGMGMSLPPASFSVLDGVEGFSFFSPKSFPGYECALCCKEGGFATPSRSLSGYGFVSAFVSFDVLPFIM